MKEKSVVLTKKQRVKYAIKHVSPAILVRVCVNFAYNLFLDDLQELNLELQNAVRLDVLTSATLAISQP